MPDKSFQLYPEFLPTKVADSLLQQLLDGIEWRQDKLKLYGREHFIPRLHQWYADADVTYAWSGIDMQPREWLSPLNKLLNRLQEHTGHTFNSALANLYRDGNDSMGWHADNEPELGPKPVIASISLGAERDFQIRTKNKGAGTNRVNHYGRAINLPLPHGSLLLMSGNSQRDWQHALPKRRGVTQSRLNLTFRKVDNQRRTEIC